MKIKPSVKLVLAYVYATGDFPKHIHMQTYLDARKHTDRAEFMATGRFHYVKPESLACVQEHPLAKAHNKLTEMGFRLDRHRRNTSHYIKYYHEDGRYASAYRGGGGSITTAIYSEGGTFLRNETERF